MPSRNSNNRNSNSSRRGSPSNNTRIESNNTERLEALSLDVENLQKSVDRVFRYMKEQTARSNRSAIDSSRNTVERIASNLEDRMSRAFKSIERDFESSMSNMEKRQNEVFSAGRSRDRSDFFSGGSGGSGSGPSGPDNPDKPGNGNNDKIVRSMESLDRSVAELNKSIQNMSRSFSERTMSSANVSTADQQSNVYSDRYRTSTEAYRDVIESINDSIDKDKNDNRQMQEKIIDYFTGKNKIEQYQKELIDDIKQTVNEIYKNTEGDVQKFNQALGEDTDYQNLVNLYKQNVESSNGLVRRQELVASLVSGTLNMFKTVFNAFLSRFTDGLNNIYSTYEQTYTGVAVAMDWNQKEYQSWQKTMNSELSKMNLDNNVRMTKVMEELSNVTQMGLSGDEALSKAMSDSINKTIAPFIDVTSDAYTDLQLSLGPEFTREISGMGESLRQQTGTQRLFSKTVNSILDSMAPIIANAEEESVLRNYGSAVAGLENSGYSTAEAIDLINSATTAFNNPYEALTSGDIQTVIAASNMTDEDWKSGDISKYIANLGSAAESLLAGVDSAVGRSAVTSTAGIDTSWMHNYGEINSNYIEGVNSYDPSQSDRAYQDLIDGLSTEDQYTTATEQLNAKMENMADDIAYFRQDHPVIFDAITSLSSTASAILSFLVGDKLFSGLSGMLGNIGNKIGGSGAASKVAGSSALGKVGSFLSGAGGKILGAGGAIWAVADAVSGINESINWLGEERGATTGGKVSSAIGSALGGTGSGLTGALSGAGKGAMIGSFLGPIGTAVGAGIGGIFGAIGGERISKTVDSVVQGFESAASAVSDYASTTVDATKEIYKEKGVLGVVSEGAKGIANSFTELLFGKNVFESDYTDAHNKSKGSDDKASYSIGIANVPETGSYTLHKGERVLKTSDNETLTSILNSLYNTTQDVSDRSLDIKSAISNLSMSGSSYKSTDISRELYSDISTVSDAIAGTTGSNIDKISDIIDNMISSMFPILSVKDIITKIIGPKSHTDSQTEDITNSLNRYVDSTEATIESLSSVYKDRLDRSATDTRLIASSAIDSISGISDNYAFDLRSLQSVEDGTTNTVNVHVTEDTRQHGTSTIEKVTATPAYQYEDTGIGSETMYRMLDNSIDRKTEKSDNSDLISAINTGFNNVIAAITGVKKSVDDGNTSRNNEARRNTSQYGSSSLMRSIINNDTDIINLKKVMSVTK